MQTATVKFILLIGAVGQVLLLTFVPQQPSQQLAVVAICLVVQLVIIALEHRMSYRRWLVIAITAVYGGLGMVLGTLLDSIGTNFHHHHHSDMNHISLWSWQNFLMLVFCFGFCWLLCPAHSSKSHRLASHFCSMTGMIVGMLLVMQLIGHRTSEIVGTQGTMHLVMLFGMIMGVGFIELIKMTYRRKQSYEDFGT